MPSAEVLPVRHSRIVGVIGTYVDDVAYTGLTVGAPEEVQPQRGADAAETVVGPALPDDEFERHTSEEDGVARDPLLLGGPSDCAAGQGGRPRGYFPGWA